MIIKPAKEGSQSAVLWSEILKASECPEGLISFVYGDGATVGKLLMDHPGVKNISFSGGYDSLKSYSLSLEKKYQLYFNGKNSVCVLGDFDFKSRMKEILRLFIEHNGKSVFSPVRILVLDTIEKDFKIALADYLKTVPTLKSIDDEFGFQPLKETEKIKLKELKRKFESEDAKLVFENENFIFYSDLPNCSEMYHENLELPIYNITAVKYSHEMARWINNVPFGHSLFIFGEEEKAKKLIQKSEVGAVIMNPSPLAFKKIRPVKMSGFGDVGMELPHPFYSYSK
jgi:aminomuconate-semialdehyde/2-hydroxymuconate-6-semialdehyde dehydrogenase